MSGSLKQHLDLVEGLIAASASFQNRVGAGNATAAKAKILREGMIAVEGGSTETLTSQRPFCVLVVDAHGYVQIDQGASVNLGGTGGILAVFTDNARHTEASAAAHKQSHDDFVDWVSSVMDEVADDVGVGAYNDLKMVVPPERAPLTDRQADDYWLCAYLFGWHINQGGG